MQVKPITPETLPVVRQRLIRFLNLHGDKRITKQGIRWLERLQGDELNKKGTLILVAVEQKKLKGLLAISDYGRDESIVVVHQQHRQKKTGVKLISEMLKFVDKCYGRVALDNTPSLKMCFAMGMVGFKIIQGPTGKPTLWLGLGNWKKEDVE